MNAPLFRSAALLALCLLGSVGCSPAKLAKPQDGGQLKLMLRSARATDCAETCKSMVLSVTAVNNSSELYCVPGEYFGADAGESVAIFPAGSSEPIVQSTPLRHEANVWSADIVSRLEYTRARPNIVLQPHKQLSWDAAVDDRFDLKRGNARVEFLMIAYPCKDVGHGSADVIRDKLQIGLTY